MELYRQLCGFVQQHCEHGGKAIDYEDYLHQEVGDYPSLYQETRDVDDLVSVTGWNTDKNGVMSLVYATLSGSLSHAVKLCVSAGVQTGQHKHNYVELAYVVRGRLVQKIMGKSVEFSEGEICLVDWDTLHTDVLLHEPATVLCFGIDNPFFEQFMQIDRSAPENARFLKQLITRKKSEYDFLRFVPKEKGVQTQHTFEMIFEELLHQRPSKSRIVKGYVERLVHLLPLEYRIVLSQKERKELGKALFYDMAEYIENNYPVVTVQRLAQVYSYNPDYISRLCQKRTGMSMSQYIQKVRIEKALGLLETTVLPVEQIARQVGYNNVGFFYKKFKEQYHTTPNGVRSV
ncbi:AraC family transcriptional regulator [Ruminococcaceae bacterium OttesenSCG-928-A11]|nr:AraC family transcriptional regulator [Ruminococcaceae bacterium OttesenSCG-928-A11]